MRCDKCGFENPDDANYCINCGRKIEKTEPKVTEKICPKCGAKNYNDSVFCSECGNMLEYKKEEQKEELFVTKKESANAINRVCLILAIIGAAFTVISLKITLALVGLTISTVALIIIAIGLLTKKLKGSIKLAIGLGIYGFLGNIFWILFILFMLPNF
ncbi:MAG: zinc ribbon domain-containing protein [Bacilli bacterium]|nr:zinc ribbon domain-containing protein [Bacilli bacterium]